MARARTGRATRSASRPDRSGRSCSGCSMNGIATRRGAMNAHRERAYPEGTWRAPGPLVRSEEAQETAIVLPLFHQLTDAEQDRVIDAVKRAVACPPGLSEGGPRRDALDHHAGLQRGGQPPASLRAHRRGHGAAAGGMGVDRRRRSLARRHVRRRRGARAARLADTGHQAGAELGLARRHHVRVAPCRG